MIHLMRHAPIGRKVKTVILVTSAAVLFLAIVVFFAYDILTFKQSTVRHFTTMARVIASNSTAALAFGDTSDAEEVLQALEAEPHLVHACLFDPAGRPFAKYSKKGKPGSAPTQPAEIGVQFDQGFMTVHEPVMQGGKRMGTLMIVMDLETMAERLRLYGVIAFLVIVTSLTLAYILSRLLERQVSEPILSLAGTARRIAEGGDHSIRAEKRGDDEIGSLTDSFNQMLDRIQMQNQALTESEEMLLSLNASLERRVGERTAELEAVNKELESFSYSVSHDLRAPLRHIDGYANLLRKDSYEKISPESQRYLGVISDAAKRMGTLIDDLLVFSRMGRSDVNKKPVRMRALVDEVVKDLAAEAGSRDIAWRIDDLPEVYVDPALFRQVWINLLSNALKYSEKKERTEIDIRSHTNGNDEVVFSVRDNGAGFDMTYAHKLFGVFQRLHRADEFEGTGIGLANVRRIVTRHGGRTWAEGKIGEGAEFFFTLPAAGVLPTGREGGNHNARQAA